SRTMGIRARDVVGRYRDGFFVIAPHDTDQAGIVGAKPIGVRLQTINQTSECGIDKTLMCNTSQQRRLSRPRHGAALRHVRGLVPGEHRPRRVDLSVPSSEVTTAPAALRS